MAAFRAKWVPCLVLLLFSASIEGWKFDDWKIDGLYGQDEKKMVHEWSNWRNDGMATFYQKENCQGERGVYTHPKGGDICDRRCYTLNGASSALLIYEHAMMRVFPTGDCSGDELEFTQPKDKKVCVTWDEAAYSFQMVRSWFCPHEWRMNEVKVPPRSWWKYWPIVEDDSGVLDEPSKGDGKDDNDGDGDDGDARSKGPRPINVEENSRKAAEMLEGATRRIGDGPDLDADWRQP